MLNYVNTPNAPAAIGPYSQGIVCGGIAWFSGQIPLSPVTGEVGGSPIEEQAERVMENIQAPLPAVPSTPSLPSGNLPWSLSSPPGT